MSLLTVEGVYKDGRIELSEHPGDLGGEARVLVTSSPRSNRGWNRVAQRMRIARPSASKPSLG
jgi:hypothetical protein